MGGNALKAYGVRRVDRVTYDRIKADALARLAPACLRCAVPRNLENKPDFGDVDILAVVNPGIHDIRAWLGETFNPRAIVGSGGVYSFNIEDLQVDLIPTSEENWDAHKAFLEWGDLGMTIGRIMRPYDLKYGIDGLSVPVRDPVTGHRQENVSLSRRPEKILPFLGYDYDRWRRGFQSDEEIRDFAFSTPRLSRDFLLAESENTKHRKRERTRPGFRRYHEWAEANLHLIPEVAPDPVPMTEPERIEYLDAAFPHAAVKERYAIAVQRQQALREAREKFSGQDIQAMFPDLTGPRLGKFMIAWKAQWPDPDARAAFIRSAAPEELRRRAEAIRAEQEGEPSMLP